MMHRLLTRAGPWTVPTAWDHPTYRESDGLHAVAEAADNALGDAPLAPLLMLLTRCPPPGAPPTIRVAEPSDIDAAVEALYGAPLLALIERVYDPPSDEVLASREPIALAANLTRGTLRAEARRQIEESARAEARRLRAEADAVAAQAGLARVAAADVRREAARLQRLREELQYDLDAVASGRRDLAEVDIGQVERDCDAARLEHQAVARELARVRSLTWWIGYHGAATSVAAGEIEHLEAQVLEARARLGEERAAELAQDGRAVAARDAAAAELAAVRAEFAAWRAAAPQRADEYFEILQQRDRDIAEITRIKALMGVPDVR